MIARRREMGLAQEGISARHLLARAIITSLGLALLAAVIIGIVIFMSVHQAST